MIPFIPAGASVPAPDGAAAPVATAPSAPHRRRFVIVGAVLSVLAVVGVVAGLEIQAKASGVHAAFESIVASPTLRIVATAQAADPSEASVSQYSVVLSVTSKDSSAPISSGGTDVGAYEISVLRGGTDLADVIGTGSAVYARVDLQAISPSDYENALQSLQSSGVSGPAYTIASDVVHDQWVGVSLATLRSFASQLGAEAAGQMPTPSQITDLRNDFSMSFSQSFDTWVSIHQISSSDGTTEYSLKLPVQHFVGSFVDDLKGAIVKDLPTTEGNEVARELGLAESKLHEIPPGLEIPMTMWVTNGSLSRLQVSYQGNTLNLDFSHPSVGVTAPQGAYMITTATLTSLFDGVLGCTGSGSGTNGGGYCTGMPTISGVTPGTSGISGITSVTGTATGAVSGATSSSGAEGAAG